MNKELLIGELWKRIGICGDCWVWSGAFNAGSGRPIFLIRRTPRGVQKLMWEMYKGKWGGERRMYALNACGNEKCVNPDHLFLSSNPSDERRVSRRFKVQQRFWEKVEMSTLEGCWEWQGAIRPPMGYGAVRVNKKDTSTHRFIWELYRGAIPSGLLVRHKCDNPKCVNLLHLELGTHADNTKDMDTRGRRARGEKTHSRFTADQVVDMRARRMRGETYSAIASVYGAKVGTVTGIVNRQSWRHIP